MKRWVWLLASVALVQSQGISMRATNGNVDTVHIAATLSVKCTTMISMQGHAWLVCDTTRTPARDSLYTTWYEDTLPVKLDDTLRTDIRAGQSAPEGMQFRMFGCITLGPDTVFSMFTDADGRPKIMYAGHSQGLFDGRYLVYMVYGPASGVMYVQFALPGSYKVKFYGVVGRVDPYGAFLGASDTLGEDSMYVKVKPTVTTKHDVVVPYNKRGRSMTGTYDILGRRIMGRPVQCWYIRDGRAIVIVK